MSQEGCKLCQREFITKYGYKWHSNGTWGKEEGLLLVLLGKEEILNILNNIEKTIGQPIGKLVSLAKRIVTLNVVDLEFLGHLMKFLIRMRLVSNERLKEALNQKFIAPIGWGVCEKVELDHKLKSALFVIKKYPSIPLIEGAVAGLVQYIFNLPGVNIKSKKENGEVEISISPLEKEIELAEYVLKPVPVSEVGLLPGNIKYEVCPKCKTPKGFSERYEWDLPNGRIIDKDTGKDQLLFTRYAVEAILGILKRELGNDIISDIILKTEKEYIRKILQEKKKIDRKLINQIMFGIRGWGNLKKIEENGKNWNIVIENPFYSEILVGFIAGFYEAYFQTESQVNWEEKNYSLKIEISPKQ